MSAANAKKLINFTPQYYNTDVAAAAASFQTTPIDGLLLDFKWTSPTFGFSTVQKTWLHADALAWSDLSAQVTALQAITWGNLDSNFVRIRLQPGYDNTVEFWNDPAMIASAVNNIGLIARAAREVGAKGVFFDWEAYHTDIQHRMLHYASLKVGFTLADRQAQVRAAMAQLCAAVWANFPDCMMFLMFGYEQIYSSPYYDLLGAAIDGCMDVAPTTKILTANPSLFHVANGIENCYYTNSAADWEYWFNGVYSIHRVAGGTFQPNYASNISLSPGIWLDRIDSPPYDTFNLVDFTNNYYDPYIARAGHASWQQCVANAFDRSDSFVWIFVESNVGYLGMPADYQAATAAAAATHRTARTEFQHRCLMLVPAVNRTIANNACASIGLAPVFNIPVIAVGDPPSATPSYYMADLEITESVYRGITVMVGAISRLIVSPNDNYDDPYRVSLWLYSEGLQLVPSVTCDPCTCPEIYYPSNETFKKAILLLLCYLKETILYIVNYISGYGPAPSVADFSPLTPVDSASIGGAYASVVDLPTGTRAVILDNQTDGNVYVSMDGGVTDTYHMTPGEKDFLDLAVMGLTTTADVQIRDGVLPPANGTFFVYSIL